EELKTILLFEADHILMGRGKEAATLFIGFPPDSQGEYCFEDPTKVDLKRFPIANAFDAGYEYAFQPSLLNTLDDSQIQDMAVFMLATPRAGGIGSGGETHSFMTDQGMCQTVSDATMARWRLEGGGGGGEFTTRELALLADMTEGAVRNALSDKSENGLRAIPGSKNPVLVQDSEALRWLSGRRGFIPTPSRPVDDRFLREHLRDLTSAERLGDLIGRRLLQLFQSIEQAKSAAILDTPDLLDAWLQGTQAFDQEQATVLADRLGFDTPSFVGKALEVILRREIGKGESA
ncbi:MAG: hypothetical protein AB7J19_01380, partial [Beijerinckiaceae bacterium]